MFSNSTRRGVTVGVGTIGVVAMVLAGCSKSASNGGGGADSPAATGTAAAQQVQSAPAVAAGSGCTFTKYGAPKLDLTTTTVGFSQSESTSNPFRDTETKSITAQAKALGIKLIQRNANANVAQQNTDIQDMIAQGAKVLIVAPENSTGLAPALNQAKAKHIPVLTIDRTVNGTACSDFIGFIGSDFSGQAKIAADDLGGALGGKGDVAVLQGTSGNNVATDRTNGFNSEVKAKYPNIKIVASQTANFDQATGQKITAQILQSNPNLKGIYAENDTMALGAIQAIKGCGQDAGQGHQGRRYRRHPAGGAVRRQRDDGRRRRDQPAVRTAGLRCPDRLLLGQGRQPEHDHQGSPLHRGQRQAGAVRRRRLLIHPRF